MWNWVRIVINADVTVNFWIDYLQIFAIIRMTVVHCNILLFVYMVFYYVDDLMFLILLHFHFIVSVGVSELCGENRQDSHRKSEQWKETC